MGLISPEREEMHSSHEFSESAYIKATGPGHRQGKQAKIQVKKLWSSILA